MNNNKPFYLKNRSAVHKLTFGLPGSGISSVMEKEITTIANNTKDDKCSIWQCKRREGFNIKI